MQASVNEHSQLEIDAFRRLQPVKVLQHRCDVLIPSRSMYKSGGGVEHRLKALTVTVSVVIPQQAPGSDVNKDLTLKAKAKDNNTGSRVVKISQFHFEAR